MRVRDLASDAAVTVDADEGSRVREGKGDGVDERADGEVAAAATTTRGTGVPGILFPMTLSSPGDVSVKKGGRRVRADEGGGGDTPRSSSRASGRAAVMGRDSVD